MTHIPTLEDLVSLANRAGKLVEAVHTSANMGLEWKGDGTPLTDADRAVHGLVMDYMSTEFPHILVIGEEGQLGQRSGKEHEYWLLMDEVDGTWAFMLGVPVFTIMFALMRGSKPVMSVIHDPIGKRTYAAERRLGAFLNGHYISVNGTLPKVPSVGYVSWPYKNHSSDMLVRGMVSGVVVGLHDMGCIPVNMVTGGYLGAMVANGKLSGMIFPGRTLHDIAAVDLLVREAGGTVTNLRGERLSYEGKEVFGYIASAGGAFHDQIVELVKEAL